MNIKKELAAFALGVLISCLIPELEHADVVARLIIQLIKENPRLLKARARRQAKSRACLLVAISPGKRAGGNFICQLVKLITTLWRLHCIGQLLLELSL